MYFGEKGHAKNKELHVPHYHNSEWKKKANLLLVQVLGECISVKSTFFFFFQFQGHLVFLTAITLLSCFPSFNLQQDS